MGSPALYIEFRISVRVIYVCKYETKIGAKGIDRIGAVQNHDDNTGNKSSLYPLLLEVQIFFHIKER